LNSPEKTYREKKSKFY